MTIKKLLLCFSLLALSNAYAGNCLLVRMYAKSWDVNKSYSEKSIETNGPEECFEKALNSMERYSEAPCSSNQKNCNPDFNYINWSFSGGSYYNESKSGRISKHTRSCMEEENQSDISGTRSYLPDCSIFNH